jgi:hypothetical protein
MNAAFAMSQYSIGDLSTRSWALPETVTMNLGTKQQRARSAAGTP